MGIHEAALAGFGRGSSAYERGRPGYPQAAADWMLERLGVGAGSSVADLGAGTGKFTRLLVRSGARVYAIEPSGGMRDQLRRAVPTATILDAGAQAIPLPDGALDAVTAAQAFHWFATEPVLAELWRVLRAEGGLGLVWNRRDLDDPLQQALESVVARYRGATPAHENDRWMDAMEQTALFEPVGRRQFRYLQHLDRAGLTDRVLSISFIAALDDQARAAIGDEVAQIAGPQSHFDLPYRTEAYLYRRTG
ncbi:MAG: class I SAM-dependent methyltransferase [Candidatus Dormibacteraeota bacterium]|nr:class I SAM-dependent methyltransferase [Candidatus Dormibacteraeota bacterium]